MDSYTPCYDIAVDLIDITTSMEQQVPITNSFGLYTVDFAAGLLGGMIIIYSYSFTLTLRN